MKITAITVQQRDKNRVNVSIDGKYRFSLDILQVTSLGVKVGKELNQEELDELERESQFGKLYNRTLEYCFVRPRSQREVRDYLYRKTLDRRSKDGQLRPGYSKQLTERVFERLVEKGHIDDENFARYWIENRHQRKGISRRTLLAELSSKGVDRSVAEHLLVNSERNDVIELEKVIHKKQSRYSDRQKFIAYLMRRGFSYDDIVASLERD